MESAIKRDVMDLKRLARCIRQLRGAVEVAPQASIIIPVNARADLGKVLIILQDIAGYSGSYTMEIILVVNNYPPDNPPPEIEAYRQMGIQVVAEPSARRPGEVIILSARALGVQAAQSEITIHFDADCRIPNSTSLLDWYIAALKKNADLAYTRVDFYGLPQKTATKLRTAIHHTSRWAKRTLLGIPTTRGSNYAIRRSLFLRAYEAGQLSVDMQVGPVTKLLGGKSVYSARRDRRVLTSARKQSGRWDRIIPYFWHRLKYNLKAIPTSRRPVTRNSWEGFDRETQLRLERDAASSTSIKDVANESGV